MFPDYYLPISILLELTRVDDGADDPPQHVVIAQGGPLAKPKAAGLPSDDEVLGVGRQGSVNQGNIAVKDAPILPVVAGDFKEVGAAGVADQQPVEVEGQRRALPGAIGGGVGKSGMDGNAANECQRRRIIVHDEASRLLGKLKVHKVESRKLAATGANFQLYKLLRVCQ